MTYMNSTCPRCNAHVNWELSVCSECNYNVGVPNQRELLVSEEVDALKSRYQMAKKSALQVYADQFESDIKQHSKAVINIATEYLLVFLQNKINLISNYNLQTEAEARLAANMQNDRQRRGTEGFLFGAYAEKIRYAALSLNTNGLISYGECTIILKDATMQHCASVLEENSFTFFEKHLQHIVVEKKGIPCGYRATWSERHLLAVAKLAAKITQTTSFAELLLKSDGDRATDEFMEVHIYGALSWQSITAIALTKNDCEPADFSRICDRAKQHAIECLVS